MLENITILFRGYMYWSEWVQRPNRDVSAKIERASMDGGEMREIIGKNEVESPLVWPNGLSLDVVNELLYFCDAYTDRIEVIELKNNSFYRAVSKVTFLW